MLVGGGSWEDILDQRLSDSPSWPDVELYLLSLSFRIALGESTQCGRDTAIASGLGTNHKWPQD